VAGPHVVIVFLLTKSQGDTGHHTAKDSERVYVCLVSLLMKLPEFHNGGSNNDNYYVDSYYP
jgi:hypothetical protein